MTPSPETLYTTPELQTEELPPETERMVDLEDGEEDFEDYDDGQPDSLQEHEDFAQDNDWREYEVEAYDPFGD